ncbi:MAG: UDP-N-acetylglucosamine:LPS N-acetylglucosamine transferase fused to family phosphoesterase, partial [Verrucomicrobiales bacterium]|nr:UDP-N-acetylglucosamine:LPS N-acetylglucosamine transferase fused to family phosphoesterase [Verrucomicrobiales bacterium]
KERPFPFLTVITDSISVNSAWFRASSDYFAVANQLTADVMVAKGVARNKIKVFGFPVSLEFSEPHEALEDPDTAHLRKILYIIHSGKKKAGKTIEELLELPRISLTIAVGKDTEMKHKMTARTAEYGKRAHVIGWTNEMPHLMRSHHLVIGKAGGATVQECIAAGTPLIVNQIIPGQEEGNATLIEKSGFGAVAEKRKEIVQLVETAFENKAQGWLHWKKNLAKQESSRGALRIAEFILSHSDETRPSAEPEPPFSIREKSMERVLQTPGTPTNMLLCDFHIHSTYSDGKLSIPEIVDFYGQLGFDCICITDHLADPRRLYGKLSALSSLTLPLAEMDEYFGVIEREKKRALRKYGMILMAGIEFNKDGLTKKSSAHLLGIDLEAPIAPAMDLPETIAHIHTQKGLAVASHPHVMKSEWGKNTLYLWENQEIFAPIIDAWEIANRNNIFTPVGLKQLRFIANSDFHKPKHINSWKTLLQCEKENAAIKECIQINKNVAITYFHEQSHFGNRDRANKVIFGDALLTPSPRNGLPMKLIQA